MKRKFIEAIKKWLMSNKPNESSAKWRYYD